jgi:hypothetical protein
MNQAHNTRSSTKSCHIATKVKMTHTFHTFVRDPPRGINRYLLCLTMNEPDQPLIESPMPGPPEPFEAVVVPDAAIHVFRHIDA